MSRAVRGSLHRPRDHYGSEDAEWYRDTLGHRWMEYTVPIARTLPCSV
jgi:hypothetical protein